MSNLLWKKVYRYEHPDENEIVELYRHRLTGSVRRVWKRDIAAELFE
jgi:hypothetical protein